MAQRTRMRVLAVFLVAALFLPSPSPAGIGDKLKKKAEKTADKAANDALNKTEAGDPAASGEAGSPPAAGETAGAKGDGAAADAKVSEVSTRFDYVPGDRVVLFDDFSEDELGEFPVQWRLVGGTFEVAEMEGERWLRCTSVDGRVSMKLPPAESLPEFWTLEFDFYCSEPTGSMLTVSGLGKGDREAWSAVFPQGNELAFSTGDILSRTPLEGSAVEGRHHVMFMARGTGLKVYMDRQRMASVPEVATAAGPASALQLRLWSPAKPMITNVRFAEGNKPAKDPFADGKLVTYGIYFDSGSDVVKPESAPVLRQIAAYLEANTAVRVQIFGHTDNQGVAAENMDLSQRRAAAVATVLAGQFKIAADRFQTDGMGDTKPISDNANAAGRAMNRRVEFTKL